MSSKKYSKKSNKKFDRTRINHHIRAREIRVIDSDGKQLGVLPKNKALEISRQKELDLVEVAPKAVPPVCRIMDYGKYRYEQTKREKEANKQHQSAKLKEIRLRPKIESHDYEVKLKQAQKFLSKRHKLRLSLRFKGREIIHKELGMDLLNKFIEDIKDYGVAEKTPKRMGKLVIVTIGPVSRREKKHKKQG